MLGVPQVLSLALLALLGGFIPYIGGLVAMVAILLVALGTAGPQTTLILLVLILTANGIVSNLLRPILYGRTVHLHPAIVLVAIPAGAAIAGIIGVFAAIPAVAFAVAIGGALIDALEPDTGPRSDRLVAGWVDRLPSGAGACSQRSVWEPLRYSWWGRLRWSSRQYCSR